MSNLSLENYVSEGNNAQQRQIYLPQIQILPLCINFVYRHEFITPLIPLKATCAMCHLPQGALQQQI